LTINKSSFPVFGFLSILVAEKPYRWDLDE